MISLELLLFSLFCYLGGTEESLSQDFVKERKPTIIFGDSLRNSIAAGIELRHARLWSDSCFSPCLSFPSSFLVVLLPLAAPLGHLSLFFIAREYFRNRLIPAQLVSSWPEFRHALDHFQKNGALFKDFLSWRLRLIGEISPWLVNEQTPLVPFVHIRMPRLIEEYHRATDAEGWAVAEGVARKATNILDGVSSQELTRAGPSFCRWSIQNNT